MEAITWIFISANDLLDYAVNHPEKENVIKRIASEEFEKGTITKECYEALMNYEVEITD